MASSSPEIDQQRSSPENGQDVRVAWLFPSLARGYYWQPVFKQFGTRCPKQAVFTSIWPGFASGYENAFEVHVLPGLRFIDLKAQLPDSRRGFILTPPSILKKLMAFDPDVIFSAGFSGWTVAALLLKLFGRARVIIYWEGCSVQSVGPSKIKRAVRLWIMRFADAAISNSDEGIRYLRDVLGASQEKLLCHPCQVPDLPLLCSAGKASLPGLKRPVFLYVGSISPRKGWRYLLEATRLLADRGRQEFSVVFVGGGEQEEELRAAIREQHLEGVVHQVGAVAYHNLGLYYRSADVFVSPTRADTWGVAVLEAMAFGKAVLCSQYAGSRQMITPGETGFIFDPFDPQQLAGYMDRFIQDKSLASRLGAHGLETMAPHTPARAAEVLADLALKINRGQYHSLHYEADRESAIARKVNA